MDFALSEEQELIIRTTREFVRKELVPHEQEVEDTGVLPAELYRELKAKAIEAGLYAANMPTEVGGAGLDAVSWILYEKELGYTGYALQYALCGTAFEHPARVRGRATRALPVARGAWRTRRLSGDDRAAVPARTCVA